MANDGARVAVLATRPRDRTDVPNASMQIHVAAVAVTDADTAASAALATSSATFHRVNANDGHASGWWSEDFDAAHVV